MIDNEATQILPGNNGGQNNAQRNTPNPVVNNQPKKDGDGLVRAAFAAGGFVAGVGSTAAVNVAAAKLGHLKDEMLKGKDEQTIADTEKTDDNTEDVAAKTEPAETQVEQVDQAAIPAEHDSIIATDEGIRVAQVDDSLSFSQAFAEARQQVGPGGVFEWHGKVYGTYYKTEWEQMSSHERAEWQAKVDYDDVRDPEAAQLYAHNSNSHTTTHTSHTETHTTHTETHTTHTEPRIASNEELVDDTPVDGEIKIIGVGPIEMADGEYEAALLEDNTGDQMLIVDIDDDGKYDVALHDDNHNGQIEDQEIHDISEWDATVQDMEQIYMEQNGIHYAVNDNLPDYSNDADTSAFA